MMSQFAMVSATCVSKRVQTGEKWVTCKQCLTNQVQAASSLLKFWWWHFFHCCEYQSFYWLVLCSSNVSFQGFQWFATQSQVPTRVTSKSELGQGFCYGNWHSHFIHDFIKKFSWIVLICHMIFQVKGNHLKNVKYMHSQVCWTQSITTSGSLFQKSDRKKLLWRAGRHQYIFSHLKWKWGKEAFTLTSTDCKNHFWHCCNNPRCQFWLQWPYLLLHWCTGIL